MLTNDTNLILTYLDPIHDVISQTYWAEGMPKPLLAKAIKHSLSFAIISEEQEIQAFCRVITDYATFAYLADVIVLAPFQGKGLGKSLVDAVLSHPELQGLKRYLLATWDAHGLYRQFGFEHVKDEKLFMEIADLSIYKRNG